MNCDRVVVTISKLSCEMSHARNHENPKGRPNLYKGDQSTVHVREENKVCQDDPMTFFRRISGCEQGLNDKVCSPRTNEDSAGTFLVLTVSVPMRFDRCGVSFKGSRRPSSSMCDQRPRALAGQILTKHSLTTEGRLDARNEHRCKSSNAARNL